MLSGHIFYHGIIKKTIVSFGRLFSSIYIDRKTEDSVTGTTAQRLQVPIAYAPKEKWLVRIDSDPTLENHTYTSLPRLSFEVTGYSYDSSRKMNRMNKITCGTGETSMSYMYAPVPYNISISLYVLTKTQEDAMQIIEQILPTFTPEYNLAINVVPEMNITQDVPVILNDISVMDEYDGDFQTRRFVTHTLNFTLKTSLYGAKSSQGIIGTVNTNLTENPTFISPIASYTAVGNTTTGNVTSETWDENF